MEASQNRMLSIAVLVVVVIGGFTIWRQREAKSRQPVIGWHELGAEAFDLKPGAYRGFSYRDVPAKFRVEVQASEPVAFGFVTPDTYGHYTSTVMPVDFATLPCGTASTTNVDLNCATQSDKRCLLLTDTREDQVPEPPAKASHGKKVQAASTLPENHVSIKMYDWRCIEHCENLPRAPESSQ